MQSHLRIHPRCIIGSHVASYTADAITCTREIAMGKSMAFLKKTK